MGCSEYPGPPMLGPVPCCGRWLAPTRVPTIGGSPGCGAFPDQCSGIPGESFWCSSATGCLLRVSARTREPQPSKAVLKIVVRFAQLLERVGTCALGSGSPYFLVHTLKSRDDIARQAFGVEVCRKGCGMKSGRSAHTGYTLLQLLVDRQPWRGRPQNLHLRVRRHGPTTFDDESC